MSTPLSTLAVVFLRLGATAFGGMWGATRQLEQELAERRAWIRREELPFLQVAATLIPAPKFMGLGGLVGYRLRGLAGSALAALALVLPGALMVVAALLLITPEMLGGQLAPMQRSVSLAVAGITFGSAIRQLRKAKAAGAARWRGLGLSLAAAVAIEAGAPVLAVALAGFALGALLFRGGQDHGEHTG